MREINLEELNREDLKEIDELLEAFKDYLQIELGYDAEEAAVASTDMENPYTAPYVMEEFEGEARIAGDSYEVRFCYTDFSACGLFHLAEVPPFEFYMFFDKNTMPDTTVGSYKNATKKYLL